jgi:hypothetical protein
VKFAMWLSLPEAVGMNRMAGGEALRLVWDVMGLIHGAYCCGAVSREAFRGKLRVTCQVENVG